MSGQYGREWADLEYQRLSNLPGTLQGFQDYVEGPRPSSRQIVLARVRNWFALCFIGPNVLIVVDDMNGHFLPHWALRVSSIVGLCGVAVTVVVALIKMRLGYLEGIQATGFEPLKMEVEK